MNIFFPNKSQFVDIWIVVFFNCILKEIRFIKEKLEEPYKLFDNITIEINKLKQTNERLENLLEKLLIDKDLEKISNQLNKLKLGTENSSTPKNNFVLAKPRTKK